jgi:diguanylate cyclase (GGDEF)-like protein
MAMAIEIESAGRESKVPPDGVSVATHAVMTEKSDLIRALASSAEAAYHWNILTDELTWSENSESVLGCTIGKITTGKQFANLLHPDNLRSRYDAVILSRGSEKPTGSNYQIQYRICPEGREDAVWLEDRGKWTPARDGVPAEAYGMVRRIDERQVRGQDDATLSGRDPLTGMMNRDRLADNLAEAISTAQLEGHHSAFALSAVSNLPLINEAYGFEIADEVIIAITKRLQKALRTGDIIGRYSGGKFGMILNSCAPKDLPMALERFLAIVRDSVIETSKGPVWAMLAVGGVSLPKDAGSVSIAMARAEEALNDACNLVTDGAIVFAPSVQRQNEQMLNARCASEIVQSLKQDNFKLAYQPIKDAKTGETVMHEALLRMIDASGEIITAGHLIPVAERLGLVRLIDRAVTQMTISALHSHPEARITMNVSATTAIDQRWYSQLLDIIASNRDVADRMTIEITEAVALNNLAETRDFVTRLRDLGCGVAIDDFGAGYTSFRNIRELPVTVIKLDGSFCRNLTSNKDNAFFVKSLVSLARTFELKVVAEWVESEDDAKLLAEWDVDYIQGNFVGPADVNPVWLSEKGAGFDLVRAPHGTVHTMLELQPQEDRMDREPAADVFIEAHIETEKIDIDMASEAEPDEKDPMPELPEIQSIATHTSPELPDFDKIYEDDIAKLRGTLSLLDEFFRSPTAANGSDQDARELNASAA